MFNSVPKCSITFNSVNSVNSVIRVNSVNSANSVNSVNRCDLKKWVGVSVVGREGFYSS